MYRKVTGFTLRMINLSQLVNPHLPLYKISTRPWLPLTVPARSSTLESSYQLVCINSTLLLLLLLSTLPVRHWSRGWRVYTEGRACSRCYIAGFCKFPVRFLTRVIRGVSRGGIRRSRCQSWLRNSNMCIK